MPLYRLIRKYREQAGLKKTELARLMNTSHTHILKVETPAELGGVLPSEDFLRKLAKYLARNPEEEKRIARRLIYEKYRDLVVRKAPEIADIFSEEDEEAGSGKTVEGMPEKFISRLKRDIEGRMLSLGEVLSNLKELTVEDLNLVLAGKKVIPRVAVIELAMALNQPIEEYLQLAEYLPKSLEEIAKNNRFLFLMRRTRDLSPREIEMILDIIERTLDLLEAKKRREEGGEASSSGSDKVNSPLHSK